MSTLVRPLTGRDLPAAPRIVGAAFGTFLGAPDRAEPGYIRAGMYILDNWR